MSNEYLLSLTLLRMHQDIPMHNDVYGAIIIASRPVVIISCGAINPERNYEESYTIIALEETG